MLNVISVNSKILICFTQKQTPFDRQNGNFISQKRKRLIVEMETLCRRNVNVVSQKRKRYVVEMSSRMIFIVQIYDLFINKWRLVDDSGGYPPLLND